MLKSFFWLTAVLAVCGIAPAAAQEALLGQYYGNGVHDYNGGNYKQAYTDLTAAIDAGTKDPRSYYYRGLSQLRMGKEQDAVADFQKGAQLEAADINNTFPVSRSLERVQGHDRLKLENYRAEARMVAFARQQKEREQRFQARKRAEEAVMRRVPEPQIVPDAGKGSNENVFGETPKQEPSKVAPAADPFAPAKGGAAADPFAPAPPKPDAPGGAAPGGAAPDPFAPTTPKPEAPGGAAPDPFAPSTPMPKPDAPKPMPPDPMPPAAGGAAPDPFAPGGAAPMPKPEAAPMPKPEAPAAGGDPFSAAPATDPPKPDAPKPEAAAAGGAKVTTKGLMSVFGNVVKSMAGADDAAAGGAAGPGPGLPPMFGGGARGPAEAVPPAATIPAPSPPAVAGKGSDDPFAAPVMTKKEAPAGDDPFGGPAAVPAPTPVAPVEAPSDDPFKDDADQSPPKALPLTPEAPKPEAPKPNAPKPASDDPFAN